MKLSKFKVIVISIALLLIVFLCVGGIYTNAKYTSKVSGTVFTEIAKYVFDVTGNDSYNYNDTIENLKLAKTCDEKTLINGKIAPGTSGSFDLIVNTNDAETGINYQINFENTSEQELPQNLVFTLDGQPWRYSDGIAGTINANDETKSVIHTINWSWDYETYDDDGNTLEGDQADTIDGINSFDYSLNITAIGTQVAPQVAHISMD